MPTFLTGSSDTTSLMVPGMTADSGRLSRKMKLPISTMPAAVLLGPITGMPFSWAIGSAAKACADSVGPTTPTALSSSMTLVMAAMAPSFVPVLFSIAAASLLLPR